MTNAGRPLSRLAVDGRDLGEPWVYWVCARKAGAAPDMGLVVRGTLSASAPPWRAGQSVAVALTDARRDKPAAVACRGTVWAVDPLGPGRFRVAVRTTPVAVGRIRWPRIPN